MTNDELKEKVIEKLNQTTVRDSLEWIDLQTRMRKKAKSLGWQPGFTTPTNEPDENVYYYTIHPPGPVLKEKDFPTGITVKTHFSIQEHGRYRAEALAFLEIFKTARQEGKGS